MPFSINELIEQYIARAWFISNKLEIYRRDAVLKHQMIAISFKRSPAVYMGSFARRKAAVASSYTTAGGMPW